MAANNVVRILVAPPDNLETNLIKETAGILNRDPYETRLLLSGKIPKLIAYYPSAQEAELITNRLKALGLVAVTCSDRELRESPSTRFMARAMKFGDREITFWDKGNQMIKLEPEDVFLILKGRLQSMTGKDVTKTSLKFSLRSSE